MNSTDSLGSVYAPQSIEPQISEFWLEGGFFSAAPDDRPRDRRFTIVIPPPNVTGALHLGHAINNVLQDILVRWHRMRGFNTLWVPGTDHAGIATQAVVERRLFSEEGLTRHDVGREELVRRIWSWKDEYDRRILGQLQRLGSSCDWSRTRFTLDDRCAKAVRHTFYDWFKDGYIYRDTRLVNWDTQLQTAVSDDEVYHETVQTNFWHIRYPLIDPGPNDPKYIVVATTRPETMLGDVAVAVNPNDERYRHLVGRKVRLPIANREIPIIADDWADPEKGSGAVKITPAHDFNDNEVGKRHNLPEINVLNLDGTIGIVLEPDNTLNLQLQKYHWKSREDARRMIVEDLKQADLIEKIEEIETEVGHSDRSKTRIETLPSLQWFVRMDHLAQTAMDAVEDGRVKIHPARYARTYLDWLGEKRDWCISRQLWWGHRIPIWYCNDCEQKRNPAFQVLDQPLIEVPGKRADRIGLENATPILGPDPDSDATECPKCRGKNLVQDPDVLDTWFSSQLWPHSTLGWPEATPDLEYYYPTSVLITSRDIISLWVARMVIAGLYNRKEVPFRDVYIHCKILDGQGRTMSKSAGNGVDPLDIIDKYGCDALRFTMADMATETQDVRMPVRMEAQPDGREINVSEKFEVGRNFCNKLWNAARFAFLNLEGAPYGELDLVSLPIEDRWILSRLSSTVCDVHRALNGFQFSRALNAARSFFWDELCDWYLELVKSRIADDRGPDAARQVLACCLDQTLRLLHPFVPFITERLWRQLNEIAPERGLPGRIDCPGSPALVIASFPPAEGWPVLVDRSLTEAFEHLQEVTRGVRDVRMRHNVSPRELLNVMVKPAPDSVEPMRRAAHIVKKLARIGELTVDADAVRPPNAASVVVGSVQIFVLDCVDEGAEGERLRKEVGEVDKLIAGKEKKLSNAGFVDRAPSEVVQRERERLAELRSRRKNLSDTLAMMQGS